MTKKKKFLSRMIIDDDVERRESFDKEQRLAKSRQLSILNIHARWNRSASQFTVSFIRSPSASLKLEIVGLLCEILRSLRYSILPFRTVKRVYRRFLAKWDTSPIHSHAIIECDQSEYFYKIYIAHLFRYDDIDTRKTFYVIFLPILHIKILITY